MVVLAAKAQVHTPNINVDLGGGQSIGAGVSYGFIWKRKAEFVGATLDYSKMINDKFVFFSSLAFDSEVERFEAKPSETVNTFSLVLAGSYLLLENVTLTTGFAKGFLNDSNPQNTLKFADADLGTGLAVGYFPPITFKNKRLGLSISSALEYNITGKEFSTSFDLGISYTF